MERDFISPKKTHIQVKHTHFSAIMRTLSKLHIDTKFTIEEINCYKIPSRIIIMDYF